jgi:hypothetical protein
MARAFVCLSLALVCLLCTSTHAGTLTAPVLGPQIVLPTRPLPRALAIGDFDHDGRGDLAVACETDSFVTIFYSQVGGGFEPPVDLVVGPAPTCLVATDWNHDGNLDLVVGIGSANPRLRAFLGDGARGFAVGAEGALPSRGLELQVADLDGDGLQDLVGVAAAPPSDGFVFQGSASGTFSPRVVLPNAGDSRAYVAVGRFDADTLSDVYIPSPSGGFLYRNLGGLNFSMSAVAGSSGGAGTADFNQDAKTDLLVGAGTQLKLLPAASGGFGAGTSYPLPPGPFAAIATADLDGNGLLDGIIEHLTGYGFDVVLLGCGGNVLGTQFYATGANPIALATGDLDGDGHPDVATADYGAASVSVRLMNPPTATPACVPHVSTSASLNFGTRDQGHASDAQLTVTNVGDLVLHLGTPATDDADFTVVSVSNSSVGVGAHVTITVRDHRFSLGIQQGTLSFPTDDPDHPLVEVALNGTSVAPARIGFDDGLAETPEIAFNATTQRTLVAQHRQLSHAGNRQYFERRPGRRERVAPPARGILTTTPLPVDRLDATGSLWNIRATARSPPARTTRSPAASTSSASRRRPRRPWRMRTAHS